MYISVIGSLVRRVYEHHHKLVEGFTKKYNVSKLVYYEVTIDVKSAIARKKQIKGWVRRKKVALIGSLNPYWVDLYEGWYEGSPTTPDSSSFREGFRMTERDR